jgi:hypothetical protein
MKTHPLVDALLLVVAAIVCGVAAAAYTGFLFGIGIRIARSML